MRTALQHDGPDHLELWLIRRAFLNDASEHRAEEGTRGRKTGVVLAVPFHRPVQGQGCAVAKCGLRAECAARGGGWVYVRGVCVSIGGGRTARRMTRLSFC